MSGMTQAPGGGEFIREDSGFRDWIQNDPSARFQPESGRYHLYVSLACPWAHRTLIFRELKALTGHIDVTVVSPDMLSEGWVMSSPEPLFGFTRMHQIYTHAKPDYTGRVTVPVLWDKQHNTIVSNESSEIIRMFNSDEKAFEDLFAALDQVDSHLASNRYLAGREITEADWRLFTTLVRFEAVYVGHVKCNKKRIEGYSNLQGYLKELF